MNKIKDILAIIAAKSAVSGLKLLNRSGGTSLPGVLALKISPEFLTHQTKQCKEKIISVSGTNGKTTTSGLLAAILKEYGKKITHNRKGANMLTGITSAVAESSSILGKLDVDFCLFETDEAYLAKTCDFYSPDIFLITNLFRDQLDRYGELDTTAKKIQQALDKVPEAKVLLNADDPNVARLGETSNEDRIFYGFEDITFDGENSSIETVQETSSCKCKKSYFYSKIFYGHIGHYECGCGIKRPNTDISARAQIYLDKSVLNVNYKKENFDVTVNLPGVYNAYNALGAVSTALVLGIPVDIICKGLSNYSTVFGRAETVKINNREILIQLIKNPIGATEVLRTVMGAPESPVLVLINDDYADGRDVSWLWDANFGLLKNHKAPIITGGTRGSDMAVRLKYAGLPKDNIKYIENIDDAFEEIIKTSKNEEKIFVLPTYTALLHLQNTIKKYK